MMHRTFELSVEQLHRFRDVDASRVVVGSVGGY
jgi:hypothetical protein